MKTGFERVLVALDLSPADRKILQMVAALEPLLGFRKIYFFHVVPDFKMPGNIEMEFHKLFAPEYPIDEKIRGMIAQDVQEIFGERPGVDMQIDVVEGKPFQKLMHWMDVKDIDLIVVGHKQLSEGSGIVARRVARQSHCHVLFVPDNGIPATERILAPVDFSDASARSLKEALALAKAQSNAAVKALYVVDMPPSDYYMRSFDSEGFRAVLRQSAKTAFVNFLQEQQIDPSALEEVIIDNAYSNVALHISEYAQAMDAGMIVIGAQGHSPLENFIFGSVTEKVVDRQNDKAVLVIR